MNEQFSVQAPLISLNPRPTWPAHRGGEFCHLVHLWSCEIDRVVPGAAAKPLEIQARPAISNNTMADWGDWQAYYGLNACNHQRRARFRALQERSDVAAAKGKGLPDEGQQKRLRGPTGQVYATARTEMLGTSIRTFLTAYVQRAYGLDGSDLSQAKLAAWLTEVGYPVTVHDVKNAGRSQLHEHASPATPEVMVGW